LRETAKTSSPASVPLVPRRFNAAQGIDVVLETAARACQNAPQFVSSL